MRTRRLAIGLLFGGLLAVAIAGPAFAHHAWTGYDMSNLTTVKATFVKMDFVNPHVWMSFDVKDDKGNIVHWACETISPGKLARGTGWSRDVLKPGDQVTIVLSPAKAGTPVGGLRKIIFADGHELSPNETAPTY